MVNQNHEEVGIVVDLALGAILAILTILVVSNLLFVILALALFLVVKYLIDLKINVKYKRLYDKSAVFTGGVAEVVIIFIMALLAEPLDAIFIVSFVIYAAIVLFMSEKDMRKLVEKVISE